MSPSVTAQQLCWTRSAAIGGEREPKLIQTLKMIRVLILTVPSFYFVRVMQISHFDNIFALIDSLLNVMINSKCGKSKFIPFSKMTK